MWPFLTLILTQDDFELVATFLPLPTQDWGSSCLASDGECVCAPGVRTLVSHLAHRQLEEEVESLGSVIAHGPSGI